MKLNELRLTFLVSLRNSNYNFGAIVEHTLDTVNMPPLKSTVLSGTFSFLMKLEFPYGLYNTVLFLLDSPI